MIPDQPECCDPSKPRLFWLPAVMLVLAGYLVYGNSFHSPLALDDLNSIIKNPGIRRLWPLSAALTPPPGPISFFTRPVINLTMAWDYAHSGENVTGYRRTNLTIHILAGVMLYLLLGRVMKRRLGPAHAPPWTDPDVLPARLRDFFTDGATLAAFVAALLWMAHPLNTAAVNYLSQRGELLVALFLFLLLYSLLRAAEAGPAGRWKWQGLAAASCLLGMGSKENMLVAPALALLFDRLFLADSWRGVFRQRGLAHAVLWLTALWPIHRQWIHSPHITPGIMPEGARWHYLLTQCRGLTRMIRLAFWPQPLVFFYGMGLITEPLAVLPQALFLLILSGATLWALVRHPRAGFAGAFFFGVLAPSSTFIPILGQPIAEHRMYAPLAALVALVAGGAFAAAARTRRREDISLFLFAGLLLAAGFGLAAHRRNADYRDPLVLWQDTVRKIPGSPEPRNDYANTLWEAGRNMEAVQQYQEALRLKPDYVDAHNNLGTLFVQIGRREEAVRHLEEALRLKPNAPQIHHNLGSVYEEMGRYEDALPHLERAREGLPGNAQVIAQLAHVLAELNRGEEALERIHAALRLQPGDPELNNSLGVLLCRLGRPSEALDPLRAALAASPERTRVRFNLGRALFEAGRLDEAEAEFRRLGTSAARDYLEKIERLRAGGAP